MLLEAQKISCSRSYRPLFKDLSINLESGQLLLIEGDNGSGKSTLLKILSGLRKPDKGSIFWDNNEITQASTNYQQQIVWLSHRNGIIESLTAKENIQVAASYIKSKVNNINFILEKVGLKAYANTPVRQFSAGMKRRLALSRLILSNAALWILDEPQSALDKIGIDLLEGMIQQHVLNGGMVIMSSHHDINIKNIPVGRLAL